MDNIRNQVLLDEYYGDNAKRIREVVDRILLKFGGIYQKDYDDFYSLANEVFVDVLKRYDETKDFHGFLYSCLLNKIKTEITARNRKKRKIDRFAISLNYLIEDNQDMILSDVIAGDFDIEKELFCQNQQKYSSRMNLYLGKLSKMQKKILELCAEGYSPQEIQKELHISAKIYSECKAAIGAYRNTSVLF